MYDVNGQGTTCYPINDFIMKRFVKEWQESTDRGKNNNRTRVIPAPLYTCHKTEYNDNG
jgi:hypothetical protein